MKKIACCFVFICLLIAGCEKSDWGIIKGDFWLKMGDNTVVSASDINMYDVSTHTIYLKRPVPYLQNNKYQGMMSVYVDDEEIYQCSFHALYLSSLPTGPYISTPLLNNNGDIIKISFIQFLDANHEPTNKDPRDDKRIMAALKKNHLYHEGLHCEIQSVYYANGELTLKLELSNPDIFDYYYLDPDKMGFGLFHYFTNGPTFWDYQYQTYSHKETVIQPDPWDSWKKEWLTLIRSGQHKKITISYNHFEKMPAGRYRMYFEFPGLNNGISQKDLEYKNGRIWMGSLSLEKEINL